MPREKKMINPVDDTLENAAKCIITGKTDVDTAVSNDKKRKITPKDLLSLLKEAILKFYEKNSKLVQKPGMERVCVPKISSHLEDLIEKDIRFHGLSVDCEYDKNGLGPKILPSRQNGARPDIIIHKRWKNNNNQLVLEFKYWGKADEENDALKLKEFTDKYGEYQYNLGVLVRLMKTPEQTIQGIKCFQNGQEVDEHQFA